LLDWCQERQALQVYILARWIFLKAILIDLALLKKRWPDDAAEMLAMYLIVNYLVKQE
jgi:hypothetical protein